MQASSRILELVDAALARGEINARTEVSPDLPTNVKELIVANAMTTLTTLCACGAMSRQTFDALREDLQFVCLAGFGADFLTSPSFLQAFKLSADDCRDSLKGRSKNV